MKTLPTKLKPLNERVKDFLPGHKKLCHQYSGSLDKEDLTKSNIFMGIGYVSAKEGLSVGLPIDILNMLITTDEIIDQCSPNSQIHLLIADYMAFEAYKDNPEKLGQARKISLEYQEHILSVLAKLGMEDKVVIHFASDIAEKDKFKKLVSALENLPEEKMVHPLVSEVMHLKNNYTNSHKFYFIYQTAFALYFNSIYECSLKVGWAKSKELSSSVIYDEPHFDRFLRAAYPETNLSFVYVSSGRTSKDDLCVPYMAAAPKKSDNIRILFGDSVSQPIPGKAMQANIKYYYEHFNRKQETQKSQKIQSSSIAQDQAKEVQSWGAISELTKLMIDLSISDDSRLSKLPARALGRINRYCSI